MDYPYQLPRYVHRDGAVTLVSTEEACDAALADGYEIHPSLEAPIAADVDEDAAIDPDAAIDADPSADVDVVTPKKKRKR